MKRKLQFIICVFCTAIIYLGVAPLLKVNEADAAGTSEVNNSAVALEWGFKFASAIPVKPHIVDRSKSQYSVLEYYLEADLTDDAAIQAARIADWRRCLFNADLAYYYTEKKDSPKVAQYIGAAFDCRNGIDGWQAGWQKDRVLLRIAEAQVMAGQWGDVEKIEEELPSEFAARTTALRFSRMDGPADYEKRLDQLKPLEISEHMEVQRDVALAYIEILKQLGNGATDEQCATLQARIYRLSEKLPLMVQHEIFCSLSRDAFEAGHGDMGRDVLNDATGKMTRRELNARYDVAALSELARIWQVLAGESRKAASLLEKAETLMSGSGLKSTNRVAPLVSLALGYGVCGKEDDAWNYVAMALHAAESQVNARPRAIAITEICNGIARWGAPLSKDIEKELIRLHEGLGDPW